MPTLFGHCLGRHYGVLACIYFTVQIHLSTPKVIIGRGRHYRTDHKKKHCPINSVFLALIPRSVYQSLSSVYGPNRNISWIRHFMEMFFGIIGHLLGGSPVVIDGFPSEMVSNADHWRSSLMVTWTKCCCLTNSVFLALVLRSMCSAVPL